MSNLAIFGTTTAVISGLGIAGSYLAYFNGRYAINAIRQGLRQNHLSPMAMDPAAHNNKIDFYNNAVFFSLAGPVTGGALAGTKMSAEYAWNCLSSAAMGESTCGPYGSLASLGIGTLLTFVAANVVTASARFLAASAQHAILGSHG